MNKKIYLSPPHIGNKEIKAVKKALLSGWIAPAGTYINQFSSELEDYFKSNVLLTNSGSSAIHLAIKGLDIQKGDIVLCSNFTFAASAFPILYEGAIPFFLGIETQTWNINPEFLKNAIIKSLQKNKKPKALVLAYSYGMPADFYAIKKICDEYKIPIIEDAAESLGSFFHKKPLGSLGKFGVLSFNGNKIITCSSGGTLISTEKKAIEIAQKRSFQAKENTIHYEHHEVGYNYAQSNILAAIGVEQFYRLKQRVKKRRKIFDFYRNYLEEIISSYPHEIEGTFSNRWLSTFVFLSEKQKDKIMQHLTENNIESRPLWNPLHLQKAFPNALYEGDLYELELFKRGICLPSGSNLRKEDLKRICDTILQSIYE